jgi:hypothetical protein
MAAPWADRSSCPWVTLYLRNTSAVLDLGVMFNRATKKLSNMVEMSGGGLAGRLYACSRALGATGNHRLHL